MLGVQVFSKWKNQKRDVLRKQEEEAIAERKRKGILSGREIFAQVCFFSCWASRSSCWPFRLLCLCNQDFVIITTYLL